MKNKYSREILEGALMYWTKVEEKRSLEYEFAMKTNRDLKKQIKELDKIEG